MVLHFVRLFEEFLHSIVHFTGLLELIQVLVLILVELASLHDLLLIVHIVVCIFDLFE